MSIQSDIEGIKVAVLTVEQDIRRAQRSANRLHNLLSAKLKQHGALLGFDEGEITAMGGGTDKTPPPDED